MSQAVLRCLVFACLLLGILVLTACDTSGSDALPTVMVLEGPTATAQVALARGTPPPTSLPTLPDHIIRLAQSSQLEAPAMAFTDQGAAAFWWGDTGVRTALQAAQWTSDGPTDVITLPAELTQPYALSAHPVNDLIHLLWLGTDPVSGANRLFSLLLEEDLTVLRGALPVSPSGDTVTRYTAVVADGLLWVLYSSGSPAEPTVYAAQIDIQGRVRAPVALIDNAAHPALATTDNAQIAVFWTQATTDQVFYGRIQEGAVVDAQSLTNAPRLEDATRVIGFSASITGSETRLFWNTVDLTGIPMVWVVSGSIDAPDWPAPDRLTLSNGAVVSWVQPAERSETAAAVINGAVGRLTFDSTTVQFESIYTPVRPLRPPAIAAGASTIFIAWAEPEINGPAMLLLAMDQAAE